MGLSTKLIMCKAAQAMIQQLLGLQEGCSLTHRQSQLPSAPRYIPGRPCCVSGRMLLEGMACMAVAACSKAPYTKVACMLVAQIDKNGCPLKCSCCTRLTCNSCCLSFFSAQGAPSETRELLVEST